MTSEVLVSRKPWEDYSDDAVDAVERRVVRVRRV